VARLDALSCRLMTRFASSLVRTSSGYDVTARPPKMRKVELRIVAFISFSVGERVQDYREAAGGPPIGFASASGRSDSLADSASNLRNSR
jgi:hypothetical protein